MTYKTLFVTFLRKLSLSIKLLALLCALCAIVLGAFTIHNYIRTRTALHEELKTFSNQLPARVIASLEPALFHEQYALAEKILHAHLQDERVLCMAFQPAKDAVKPFGLIKQGDNLSTASSCKDSHGAFTQTMPLSVSDDTAGRLTVVYDRQYISQALRSLVRNPFIELLVLLCVLCPALYLALRRLVFSPLNNISDTAQKVIDTQIFSTRPSIEQEDEVGRLTRRFNMMLDEIKARDCQLQSKSNVLQEEISSRNTELADKNAALKSANKRLMELDQLKSDFLSTVSHDLRTPLTSILGFSKLINQDFCKLFLPFAENDNKLRKRGERIKHNLLIIQHEGERLTRLINDFLDLSRIESGRMQWRNTDISIRKLTKRAAEAVQGQLSLKPDLELRLDIQETLPMLHCDEDRIMQVLVNLLNNAIKFTSSGHVGLRAGMHHDNIRFEVQDTGPGIPSDQLVKIFDKFHKVEEAEHQREKKPAGTGLGLAICRETVQHYNGRIWAESEPGKGSTFIFELPGFQRIQSKVCNAGKRPSAGKTRILVVDDNVFIREYFNQLLCDAAYEVLLAKSGEEALEKAREVIPDLIVMDLLMPGMGGEMAVRHFRSDPQLSCVPILIISISQETLDYSGDARLEKPVDPEHFLEVVNSLLRQRQAKTPVLVVGKPDCLPADMAPDSETVRYVETEAVAEQIASGFKGTVILSRNTLNELSLDLHQQPVGLHFLIVGCA